MPQPKVYPTQVDGGVFPNLNDMIADYTVAERSDCHPSPVGGVFTADFVENATKEIKLTMGGKYEVIGVFYNKRNTASGANANLIEVGNGGTAAGDLIVPQFSMAAGIADEALVSAQAIDDGKSVLDVGDVLHIKATHVGGDSQCRVFVQVVARQ